MQLALLLDPFHSLFAVLYAMCLQSIMVLLTPLQINYFSVLNSSFNEHYYYHHCRCRCCCCCYCLKNLLCVVFVVVNIVVFAFCFCFCKYMPKNIVFACARCLRVCVRAHVHVCATFYLLPLPPPHLTPTTSSLFLALFSRSSLFQSQVYFRLGSSTVCGVASHGQQRRPRHERRMLSLVNWLHRLTATRLILLSGSILARHMDWLRRFCLDRLIGVILFCSVFCFVFVVESLSFSLFSVPPRYTVGLNKISRQYYRYR